MKVYHIFIKNVKVVSRNWVYFLVLFVFPFFLIAASAILLNSNDVKNLRIGVVDETPETLIEIKDIGKSKDYSSLAECMLDLTSFEISVCIHARNSLNGTLIDVYLDNSRRTLEMTTRQLILESLFEKQADYIETTSSTVESKLAIFSSSLNEAEVELEKAEVELEEQEQTLIEYKRNLTLIKTEFDRIYEQFKKEENNTMSLRSQIEQSQFNLEQNISLIRSEIDSIRSNVDLARDFLVSTLPPSEYAVVVVYLNSIYGSLNRIDLALDSIEGTYPDSEVISLLDGIDLIIKNLDQIKEFLDNLEKDLDDTIIRTRDAKEKVASFREDISYLQTEIVSIENLEDESLSLRFNNAFSITQDLVIIAFPYVISIIITFSSLVLSNKFVLTQVNNPSYLRENISPTRDSSFLIADYLINVFFIAIQVVVLMLVGVFWFNVAIDRIPLFIITIFLASSTLIFLGLSIGYMIRTESLSVLLTIFFVMFLNIFSDILVPYSLSGPFMVFLIDLNPFVILNNALRDIILLGKTATEISNLIFRLCVLFVSSASIAYISKKASKDSILQ